MQQRPLPGKIWF